MGSSLVPALMPLAGIMLWQLLVQYRRRTCAEQLPLWAATLLPDSAVIANHVSANSPSPPSAMQVLALPAGAAALAESDTARYEIWGWGGNVLAVQVRAAWW